MVLRGYAYAINVYLRRDIWSFEDYEDYINKMNLMFKYAPQKLPEQTELQYLITIFKHDIVSIS